MYRMLGAHEALHGGGSAVQGGEGEDGRGGAHAPLHVHGEVPALVVRLRGQGGAHLR